MPTPSDASNAAQALQSALTQFGTDQNANTAAQAAAAAAAQQVAADQTTVANAYAVFVTEMAALGFAAPAPTATSVNTGPAVQAMPVATSTAAGRLAPAAEPKR